MTNVPADIRLSSGRVIAHVREARGNVLATPTTGYYAMTKAEYAEYSAIRGWRINHDRS